MRTLETFELQEPGRFKQQLLQWGQQFEEVVWLDSNNFPAKYASFDALLAVDAFTALKTDWEEAFDKLQEYQSQTSDWIFGYLSYDLKNDTENLSSHNLDGLGFADLYFFQPKKLFLMKGNKLEVQYLGMVDDEIPTDLKEIKSVSIENKIIKGPEDAKRPIISQRISKEEYLRKLEGLLQHIHRGDIYEANFCQEFFAEGITLDPLRTFNRLNEISHPPFAAFMKLEAQYLLSASPERYLRKEGRRLISQPIKGTAARSVSAEEDAFLAEGLRNDVKERSENIMIVDLVRNDLSRTASRGSVKVEELCGIYSFRQVHQMISTVVSTLEEGVSAVEAVRSTFPMGSMTGAPKVSAMQIIEELEESKRGLYSGALGYFTPEGDFDFNVVIRSILYNRNKEYASFSVGSAITAKSVPEKEYQECLLKAKAMRETLEALGRCGDFKA